MLKVTSAKLTGTPGPSGWSQVHEFKPEDQEKFKLRGHLFAVVATDQNSAGIDQVVAGRELLARLHEEYYGNTSGSVFNTLKSSLEKIISEFGSAWGRVEVAAVVIMNDVVYSAVGGGSQISILRNGMLANILTSSAENVVAASGYPKQDDMLILSTSAFNQEVTHGVVKAALETQNPSLAAETLAPAIHSQKDNGNVGAIIISFSKGNILDEAATNEIPLQQSEDETPAKIKLKPKTLDFVNNFKQKTSRFLSDILPQRKIYVRRPPQDEMGVPGQKRTMVSVGIVLIILLIVSIGFGIKQKKNKDYKSQYQQQLDQAQHNYQEAVSLFSLDPDKSRQLFSQSTQTINSLKDQGIKDPAIDELAGKLLSSQEQILGIYSSDPQLFLDLSILTSGFEADSMFSTDEAFYVLDKNGKRVVSISYVTKKTEIVAGPESIEKPLYALAYDKSIYTQEEDGIYQVDSKRQIKLDKDWSDNSLSYIYGGNLYILDKTANMIYRFPGVNGSFGSRQDWLSSSVSVDFSSVKSLVIDGSIWVVSDSGKITKFSLGSTQGFSIKNEIPTLDKADALFTSDSTNNLYILDTHNKRVLVVDKGGQYKAQYVSDSISAAKSLVVSEAEKKIILLSDNKLLYLDIKN